MFDFDRKISKETIKEIASSKGVSELRVAIDSNGYRHAQSYWPEISNDVMEFGDAEAKLIELLIKQGRASKGVVGLRAVYEAARKVKPFVNQVGVMTMIKDSILPVFECSGYTCLIGEKIYLNPRLLEPGMEVIIKDSKVNSVDGWHKAYNQEEVERAIKFYRASKKFFK